LNNKELAMEIVAMLQEKYASIKREDFWRLSDYLAKILDYFNVVAGKRIKPSSWL